MFVLGIDPGLTTTGYAVLRSSRPPQVDALGVIRTDRHRDTAARLHELGRDLEMLLREHRPDVLAIEQVFVNRNLQTAISVARASGVILAAAAAAGCPVVEYTPSAVKAAVAGYGNAPKEQVQRMVARRLGLDSVPKPADAADALAVALCHTQAMAVAP